MTLDYRKTAHDCAVAEVFVPPLFNRAVYHNGRNWIQRGEDGVWRKTTQIRPILWSLAHLLPADDPYWDRTRNILGHATRSYAIAQIIATACDTGMMPRPAGVQRWLGDESFWPCLCRREVCRQPERIPLEQMLAIRAAQKTLRDAGML